MNPSDVIDDTTLHYCLLVLEISEHSPYGITKKEKSKKIIVSNEEQDKFNKTKISENMQCFSYNSKTPMCIISVNEDTFGKVRATNLYFNLLIGI